MTNDSSKVLNLILAQHKICANDILYALSKVNLSATDIARECNVDKSTVSLVIHGKRRSTDVATLIAAKLNTTTRRLWGDAYDFSTTKAVPVNPQQAASA